MLLLQVLTDYEIEIVLRLECFDFLFRSAPLRAQCRYPVFQPFRGEGGRVDLLFQVLRQIGADDGIGEPGGLFPVSGCEPDRDEIGAVGILDPEDFLKPVDDLIDARFPARGTIVVHGEKSAELIDDAAIVEFRIVEKFFRLDNTPDEIFRADDADFTGDEPVEEIGCNGFVFGAELELTRIELQRGFSGELWRYDEQKQERSDNAGREEQRDHVPTPAKRRYDITQLQCFVHLARCTSAGRLSLGTLATCSALALNNQASCQICHW